MDASDIARQAEMFANRCRKRHRHFAKKYAKAGFGAFRIYNWDIPEIRATADLVEGHLVVSEFARTQTGGGQRWIGALAEHAADTLGIPQANVFLKTRGTRVKGENRYGRLGKRQVVVKAQEANLRFELNLSDYIDTGLFLDHRETRLRVQRESKGRRVLNLFCYTGTFSCHAAKGGATHVTSVDQSNTYLDWAERNHALNGLDPKSHDLVRDDVFEFLDQAARANGSWDLIVLDPPSYSTLGAGTEDDTLDLLRDHPLLIRKAVDVLAPGGRLYFSTNHQGFSPRFSLHREPAVAVQEITNQVIPEEFANRPSCRTFLFQA